MTDACAYCRRPFFISPRPRSVFRKAAQSIFPIDNPEKVVKIQVSDPPAEMWIETEKETGAENEQGSKTLTNMVYEQVYADVVNAKLD